MAAESTFLTIGIDPDLHTSAYAVLMSSVAKSLDAKHVVIETGLIKIPAYVTGPDAAVMMARKVVSDMGSDDVNIYVEFPQVYRGKERAKGSITLLQIVAGAAVTCGKRAFLVVPQAWKGTVSKPESNTATRIGLGLDSKAWSLLKQNKTQHELDAIGIALYGANREARDIRTRMFLEAQGKGK